jgi:circadian clock protein KaiC
MKKQNATAKSEVPGEDAGPPAKVAICKMPTGVCGLDDILGGGIPEFSFNVIAGNPGCGKTTLAHQIVFANATLEKPALYFTILGEPALKMMRYQQQYSFFEAAKLGKAIRFVNLANVAMEQDLNAVMEEIIQQVTALNPGIVVVDSFRTVVRKTMSSASEMDMQSSIQRLAQFLTSWEATAFLVGEYSEVEIRDNPLFTIADGLLWLWQVTERNSVVRKMQIMKLRGQASVPGLHTIRISDDGLQAFPRTLGLTGRKTFPARRRRLSMGIPELDQMMGGGIPEGDSLLVAGPSGTGKSALSSQFIAEGQQAGKLEVLYLRPLDLSVDETMQAILDAIERVGAKRLVIDSLVGFEMALAPGFRADFRESLYRMIGALTGAGVTILSTVEVEDTFQAMPFSQYAISFLTDDILRLRYVEIDGQLRKVMVVIKMRGGNHSKDIREYVITDKGVMIIGQSQADYTGLTTGIPERVGKRVDAAPEPKATQ